MKHHQLSNTLVVVLLSAITWSVRAFDSASFAPHMDFAAASAQVSVALGDLDGDGRTDAVTANYWGGNISVYRNVSTTGVVNSSSFALPLNLSAGSVPVLIRLADLDGDGKLDIVSVNQGNDRISIFRNISTTGVLGSNSFAPKLDLATSGDPRWVALADLNGDGKLELVVACFASGALSLYENHSTPGNFSFGPRVDLAGSVPTGTVEAADLDGDGKLDLAIGDAYQPDILVFQNIHVSGALGASSFAAPVYFATASGSQITFGDLDGDGKIDIVAPNSLDNTVSLLRNISAPGIIASNSFAAPVSFATGNYPYSAALADLDGDGRLDIAIANSGSHTLSVFRNLATNGGFNSASLAPRVDYLTGTGPRITVVADVDGDGLLDLAVANLSQSSFSILRQTGTNAPPLLPPAPPVDYGNFNPAREFSASENPTGVWGYGWKGALDGVFTLSPVAHVASSDNGVLINGWAANQQYGLPALYINTNASTAIIGGGQAVLPTGTLWVHPGWDGQPENFGVLRFTAPSSANYRVTVTADSLYTGYLSGDTDFHVVAQGVEVFAQWLPATAGAAYDGIVALQAGETVDLAVGRGADHHSYGAGLKIAALISPTTNAVTAVPTVTITNQNPNFPELVGWWPAEDNGDDASGQNHPMMLSGGPSFVSGHAGQGLHLDGVNDYGRVNAAPDLDLGSGAGLTLELWINPSNVSQNQPLLEWTDRVSVLGLHLWIAVVSPWAGGGHGSLYANVIDRNNVAHHVSSAPGVLVPNVFQHIAMTYAKSNGLARLYVNGLMVAQTNVGVLIPETRTEMYVGWRTPNYYFSGAMDEIKLHRRALNPSEIAAIAGTNAPATNPPPVTPPVLAGNYNLSRDFSRSNNPSGAWSHGWKGSLGGSFTPLPIHFSATSDNGVPVSGWAANSTYGLPAVYCNTSASTSVIGGGQAVLPPGTIWFYPGPAGQPENFGAIRFTAPSNSIYRLETTVASLYSGGSAGDTDFHVVKNGAEIFGQSLPAHGSTSFSSIVSLNVGDTIDFAIGRGADGNEYGSSLKITALLTPTNGAPPMVTNTPPVGPSIVTQPLAYQSVSVGGTAQWTIVATGDAPLAYQWLLNGISIPGASSASLVLTNVQLSAAGTYRVEVSNPVGAVTSAAATLNVPVSSGGTLIFANQSTSRIYDVGGVNLAPAGGTLVVGLFAGPGPESLQQIGGTVGFLLPGRFSGGTRSISGMSVGQTASVQVKVWDSAAGTNYEQAVLGGGKIGSSSVFSVVLGGGITPPPGLSAMPGFSLTLPGMPAALIPAPSLTPLVLRSVTKSTLGWKLHLTGPTGATLAIETSTNLTDWTPVAYIVNKSGTADYLDKDPTSTQRFYRVNLISQ